MIDPDFKSMADYVDVESINAYQALLEAGHTSEQAFEIIQIKSRDNSRTPMQWDNTANAGFSTGTPWLATGNHAEINVENEQSGEVYQFYKQLIQLRKTDQLISDGTYQAAYQDAEHIYAFIRECEGRELLVLTNFSNQVVDFELLADFVDSEILINNYATYLPNQLQPYQAIAFAI